LTWQILYQKDYVVRRKEELLPNVNLALATIQEQKLGQSTGNRSAVPNIFYALK
jgi:hypothetical protein